MKHIIDYWENAEDKQKKLLTLTYQTSVSAGNYGFIGQCIYDNLPDIIKIQLKNREQKGINT